MRRTIFVLFVMLPLFFSCSRKPVFEQIQLLPEAVWNRFLSLKYEAEIKKEGEYDVYVLIIHDADYAYANFTIDLTYTGNSGEVRTRPHTITLRNEEGLFIGNKLENGLFELEYQVYKGLSLHQPGRVIFEIDNVMPVYNLKGIHKAGIIIRKYVPEKEKR